MIRFARSDDVFRICDLCQKHAQFEDAQFSLKGKAEALSDVLFPVSPIEPKLLCWVAEHSGIVVGYASASIDFSTWQCADYLHVYCIFVESNCRGAGLGLLLMNTIRTYANMKCIQQMQWQTPIWNESAIRFYQRLGAVNLAKQRFVWVV